MADSKLTGFSWTAFLAIIRRLLNRHPETTVKAGNDSYGGDRSMRIIV